MVGVTGPSARAGTSAWSAAAAVAPASIIVTIGILLPIVILFRYSLNQYTPARMMVDAFSIENYAKFLTDPFYLAVLFRTIRVAAVCTVILAWKPVLATGRPTGCRDEALEPSRSCQDLTWVSPFQLA